jgi:2-succinyl-5-enolpyruvyl-6-hydroxy-3-cyclohexene-1-carboxylate synthase
MKKYINRNFFWTDLFVAQLLTLGVKHVCISPGSRNTPLTIAFAENKSFKKYVHVDERSSGFFALGLAKKLKRPVALVTTSGTAVAELYPAIIEAYIQRIPLIICTADRPAYLRETGANQTINQDNIYANHIRFYSDFGLPNINRDNLKAFCKKISEGVLIGGETNPGPIHYNFPFRKPLEPNTFTDDIFYKLSDFIIVPSLVNKKNKKNKDVEQLINLVKSSKKPLIHCGWGNFNSVFYRGLVNFSSKAKIPIIADGTSEIRFYKGNNKIIITNHSAFISQLREEPDLIIQFGNAPTSQRMLKYLEKTKAQRILINKYGDIKDPYRKKGKLIGMDPNDLLNKLSDLFESSSEKNIWSNYIIDTDNKCELQKGITIGKSKFGYEPRIVNEILNIVPSNSNLFISNSLPIRDFDLFASKRKKNFSIFCNRGASGIDGIISTASGIASESKLPTFLIIGDLAFYHNISALSTLDELDIPLKIILINNNGGGIFKMLPVAEDNYHFEKYFKTPHSTDFSKVVKAFNGNYFNPKSWKGFQNNLNTVIVNNNYSVIEVKTYTEKSLELRKTYLSNISSLLK